MTIGHACGEPQALTRALTEYMPELQEVEKHSTREVAWKIKNSQPKFV